MKRARKATRKAAPSIEDELVKIGHDLASLGAALGETASSEARAKLKSLRDRVEQLAEEAGAEEIRGTIAEYPIFSVVAAFGLGVVFTSILRR